MSKTHDLRRDGQLVLNEGAAMLADAEGLTVADIYSFPLRNVMEACPTLLFGGYNADLIVVATYLALKQEDDPDTAVPMTDDQILYRIIQVIEAAFEGID